MHSFYIIVGIFLIFSFLLIKLALISEERNEKPNTPRLENNSDFFIY